MKDLKPSKPYMLKRWRINLPTGCYYFFTCARPGRTGDPASKRAQIVNDVVHRWVLGLPGPKTAIVSLLGYKPDGLSEFSFYSFSSCLGSPTKDSLSFQEWLNHYHKDRTIVVHEHPTCDFSPIDLDKRDVVAADIKELLLEGRTVVVVDSGGQTRTNQICVHIHAIEDSSHFHQA